MAAPLKLKRGPDFVEASAAPADALALLGAAYLMTDRACVIVGRARGRRTARMVPLGRVTTAVLAREFAAAFENQRARWFQARAALRADAVSVAAGASQPGEAPGLPAHRRAEIARLLAETGPDSDEARDPLRIKTSWQDLP